MKTVDRGDFTQKSGHAYQDSPQLIGYGVTISAPHMVKKNRKYRIIARRSRAIIKLLARRANNFFFGP